MRPFRLIFMASIGSLWAQSTTGTILGTVMDSSKSVIHAAKVTLTNEGTGISSEAETSESGDYVFPNLQAALYSVRVEASGFRNAKVQHIRMLLNATVRQDVTLAPGPLESDT
jgi:hypothetical protein